MTPGLFTIDPVLGHASAGAIGAALMLGALSKLRDVPLFQAVLDNYRLLPGALLAPVAWALPLVELTAGALLLPTFTRCVGAVLAIALLACVSAAVLINLLRGRRHIECGCDIDEVPLSAGLLVRNGVMVVLAFVAAQGSTQRPTVWLDLFSTLIETLFLLGLYKAVNLWLGHQSRLNDLRNAP
jgi:hypothetical protein